MWGDRRKLKLVDMYYRLKTMKIHKKIKNKFIRDEAIKTVVRYMQLQRDLIVSDVLADPTNFSFGELKYTLSVISKYEHIDKVSRGEDGERK